MFRFSTIPTKVVGKVIETFASWVQYNYSLFIQMFLLSSFRVGTIVTNQTIFMVFLPQEHHEQPSPLRTINHPARDQRWLSVSTGWYVIENFPSEMSCFLIKIKDSYNSFTCYSVFGFSTIKFRILLLPTIKQMVYKLEVFQNIVIIRYIKKYLSSEIN